LARHHQHGYRATSSSGERHRATAHCRAEACLLQPG
jgi:hypothetical protein